MFVALKLLQEGVWGDSVIEWTSLVSIITLGTTWYFHNICHEPMCFRKAWHPDEDGHPVCKVHSKDHPAKGWFRKDNSHLRTYRNRRSERNRNDLR